MSELIARIKAIQDVVREALDQDVSLEGDADLAEVLEALRFVVRERDTAGRNEPPVGQAAIKPMRALAVRARRRRSSQTGGEQR
jgi:hypothetical protein